ncbi:MAG: thiopurine S-methyltransferase [Bdellovibrionaceae bacterium]|nr:thiopurine S-methyltransferase [Bdellovibrionales bacterium]MCB9254471.1 thiopurine S-methyltransferase [Pseudobdellovibrionaceae bacterium]
MEPKFWIERWEEGSTAFHQKDFHEFLVKYWSKLGAQPGQRVLVPLCGKSLDLLWLRQAGLKVHGFELYEKAIEAFFDENTLPKPEPKKRGVFTDYVSGDLELSCGDFFEFAEIEQYDFIYDRAALVALPKEMRRSYVDKLTAALKPGGKQLLISFDYDQSKMEGPPFSVSTKDIETLYSQRFSIKTIETRLAKEPKLAAVQSKETVYILEKL